MNLSLDKRRKTDIILTVEKTVRREKWCVFFAYFLFKKKVQLVLIRARVHPFPFRTRKLSSLLPKILVWRRTGKIGNANTRKDNPLLLARCRGLFYFVIFTSCLFCVILVKKTE